MNKEKRGKTLKKRTFLMKTLRNHQFRATKFTNILIKLDADEKCVAQD
jgi:hypothetical protein